MQPPKRRARLNDPELFPLVSEEHAAAIGYVAIRWAEVEAALSFVIAVLLRIEGPAIAALTAERSNLTLLDTAGVLVRLSGDAKSISEWGAIHRRHEELRPRRNDAIHAEWSVYRGKHHARREKARGEYRISLLSIETDNLNYLAEDALTLAEDLMRFGTALLFRGVPEAVVSANPPGLTPVRNRLLQPLPHKQDQAPKKKRHQKLSAAQKRAAARQGQS